MNRLKVLYGFGAITALIAALIFRRNLAAEISMLIGQSAPNTVADLFKLLQYNPVLGVSFLNFFDIVNYVFVGVMFLALYIALRRTNRNYAAIATVLSIAGIAVYVATNTAFSMLSLSSQYANASTDAQKSALLAEGQALLTKGYPGAGYEGLGGCISLFLLAAAGLIISAVMLRSKIFNRPTAFIGMAACGFDLAYIMGLAFVPVSGVYLWSLFCIPAAGLLVTIWHVLVGVKLLKLSRATQVDGGDSQ
jgi:hypothetical protein